ncbi:MAG: glucoamylase family protein [Bacteroidota bacterium]
MKTFIMIFLFYVSTVGCQQATQRPSLGHWDPFLDTLQQRTFSFFWKTTDSATGLAPDRYPTRTFSSVAGAGFALSAYPIGVERGYVARADASRRVLTTVRFFWGLPQNNHPVRSAGYNGFFYHFLHLDSGLRFADVELSTIDSALLLAGVLFCQSYFNGSSDDEQQIRAYADSLYRRMDWRWVQKRAPLVSMGWRPEKGFIQADWRGYDEGMILYILALGSPTYPVEPDAWKAWTENYKWATYYGQEFISFGPLFGHQYSHCWIDFRGIQDEYMRSKGIDYYENSRRAALTQPLYAKANPGKWRGYSSSVWGFTACDGPGDTSFVVDGFKRTFGGYAAHGVSFDWVNDDGTLSPTAPGGSIPFAPEICIPALKTMRDRFGSKLWKEYGFVDAFNPTFVTTKTPDGWFDVDYLGIDQGPIVIMIENFRNGFVWDVMKKNPYIVRGLQRAGFSGGWLDSLQRKSEQ